MRVSRSTFAEAPAPEAGVERAFGVGNVLRALGLQQDRTRVGRYELIERIGAGGMGVVYRARDPKLDRPVAIKLLRDVTDDRSRARLRREAHALARLSDPRVVAVFGVGEDDSQTWIAMELVQGQSLEDWMEAADPATRRVRGLELLSEAGRGLAAAHRVGVAHLDFKPANVLIGEDDRVKVADFGLAKVIEHHDTPGEASGEQTAPSAAQQQTAYAGTPLYMAPEQHLGLLADARADQFAFAVSAWEVLTGTLPFRGGSIVALGEAKLEGNIEGGTELPGRIRRALLRAMRPDPDRRFPDMDALLQALAGQRSSVAMLTGLGGLAAAAIVGSALTGPSMHPCSGIDPPRWDDAQRHELEATFSGHGSVHAPEAWARLEAGLDEHVAAWTRARDHACAGATVETAPAVAACLEQAARSFDHAVGLVASTPAIALQGTALLETLPELECSGQRPLPPVSHREVEGAIGQSRRLLLAGQGAEALELLEQTRSKARELGAPSVLSRFVLALGEAQATQPGIDPLPAMQEAHALAIEARDDVAALDAALAAAGVLLEQGDGTQIRHWLDQANVAYERLGRPAAVAGVWLHIHEAQYASRIQSDNQGAIERTEHALRIARGLDASSPGAASTRAAVHEELADLHLERGDVEQATQHSKLAIEWMGRDLGDDHPLTKDRYSYLADALLMKGQYAEALAALQTALEGARASAGPQSVEVATLLSKSSSVHRFLGQPHVALQRATQALRILETIDAADAIIVDALAPVATAQQELDDLQAARATGERIVAIVQAERGPEHFDLAPALYNLGDVLLQLGEVEAAKARLQASLRIAEASLGPDAPDLAYPVTALADIAVREQELDTARALLRRAAELVPDHHDASLRQRIDELRLHAPDLANDG